MYRKILGPLDGSANSETALPAAIELTREFAAELHLLVAYDISTALFVGKDDTLPVDLRKLKEHQKTQVELYLKEKSESLQGQGFPVLWEARAADARECICSYAAEKGIDLILLNSRGRTGLMRWLTGSIAEEVLRHAPCPVLILRHATQPQEESQ